MCFFFKTEGAPQNKIQKPTTKKPKKVTKNSKHDKNKKKFQKPNEPKPAKKTQLNPLSTQKKKKWGVSRDQKKMF